MVINVKVIGKCNGIYSKKMSDELIARFRVGYPILLCYGLLDVRAYTIIELSQKDEFFCI